MATPTWITLANANQFNQAASGTAVSSFTSITDISPGLASGGQAFQVQPAQIYPGQMWRFTANGTWSSTSSPGVSVGVYYGGAAGSPLCYACVPSSWAFTNCASIPWQFQAMGKVTAVGPSTAAWQVIGVLSGLCYTASAAAVTGTATQLVSANVAAPQYTSASQYDSASAHAITLAAQCSASSGSNAITVFNWAIEYMTEP